jgi:DNA-binding transcriptional LysR family regulator
VQLVVREVRPVRLTPAGEALCRHARVMLERLSAAQAELDAIAAVETGRLRVGTYASAGATLVVQAVATFRQQHPGVHLTLIEAGRDKLVHHVRSGDLDVAAVFDFPVLGLTVDHGLDARHLLDEPHDLLLPPEHRLAGKRRVTIADLRDEDWLFPTLGPDSPTQKLFKAACAAQGYEPRIVFRVNDCEMHQALVAAGVGIGFFAAARAPSGAPRRGHQARCASAQPADPGHRPARRSHRGVRSLPPAARGVRNGLSHFERTRPNLEPRGPGRRSGHARTAVPLATVAQRTTFGRVDLIGDAAHGTRSCRLPPRHTRRA